MTARTASSSNEHHSWFIEIGQYITVRATYNGTYWYRDHRVFSIFAATVFGISFLAAFSFKVALHVLEVLNVRRNLREEKSMKKEIKIFVQCLFLFRSLETGRVHRVHHHRHPVLLDRSPTIA